MTSKNVQLKWNICKPISNFSKKFAYHILNKCLIYSFYVQFVKYWCKPGILLPRKSSSNVSISTMCFLKILCITCSFFVPSFPECPRLSLVLAPSFHDFLNLGLCNFISINFGIFHMLAIAEWTDSLPIGATFLSK